MSRLLRSIQTMTKAAALTAVLATFAACGGGGDAAPVAAAPVAPAPPDPGPVSVTVVGVQTPDNVAVVTATNAN